MKQFLFVVFFAVASLLGTAFAQTSMVTLEHKGELTVFNGTGAFAKAMEAAADGDAIYLGPGRYNAANITKAVTIKGAGFIDEKESGLYGSYLDGNLSIELPESQGVNVEGVYFSNEIHLKSDLKSSMFLRSWLQRLCLDATTENVSIFNCRVNDFDLNVSQHNMLLQNSAIEIIRDKSDGTSTLYFKNCTFGDMRYYGSLKTASIENSIVYNSVSAQSGITWINTLINSDWSLPNSSQMTNCWFLRDSDIKKIWKDSWWGLTDENAAKYVGTDGTQIGLYGGAHPFTKIVSGPRITKLEMPAETDEDGKISVSITVESND